MWKNSIEINFFFENLISHKLIKEIVREKKDCDKSRKFCYFFAFLKFNLQECFYKRIVENI